MVGAKHSFLALSSLAEMNRSSCLTVALPLFLFFYGSQIGLAGAGQDRAGEPGGPGELGEPVGQDDSIPTFRFRSSVVEEWLLLGPVSVKSKPSNPVEFLGEVQVGKEVVFSDGTRRKWTRANPREFAYVALDQFCKMQNAGGNEAIVYAFCNVVASKSESRKFSHGADDASKVWVDGELVADTSNGWYNLDTAKFEIDLQAGEPKSLLIEARNGGGDFGIGVASGRTWNGIATYTNQVTANAGVLVQLRDLASGNVVGSAISDALGRLSYRYVPYEVQVGAFDGTGQLPVYWSTDADGERQFTAVTSSPRLFNVADLLPPDYTTSHPISAVAYAPQTGEVYFVEKGSLNRLRILAGRTVRLYEGTTDLPDDVTITSVAIARDGQLYLHTENHGLLIFTDDAKMQFGAMETLEGFEAIEAPSGIYVRPKDEFSVYGSSVYVRAGGVEGKTPEDAAPDALTSTRIFCIDPDMREAAEIAVQDGLVFAMYVGPHGLAYGDAFSIYHRPDPLSGKFKQYPMPASGLRGISFTAYGRMMVLGWQTFAVMDDAGEWQSLSHSPRSHLPGELMPGKDAWICTTQRVSHVQSGQIHAVTLGDAWESSAAWENDGLLVGTVGGRILGVESTPVQTIGPTEGLISNAKTRVETSRHGVLFSGEQMQLHRWDGAQAKSLTGSISKIGYFFDADHILRLPSLLAYARGDVNSQPFYYTYYVQEDDLKRVNLPVKAEYLTMADCAMRDDGTGLLATSRGLFELEIDEARLESHQAEDAPFSLSAVDVLADGEVWIGGYDGRICRLADSSNPDNWIQVPGQTKTRRITQIANGRVGDQAVVFVGTTQGLYFCDPSGACREMPTPFGSSAFIQDIEQIRDGKTVFVSVRNMGAYIFEDDVWARIDIGEQLQTSTVWDIEPDPSGGYWLTTDDWYIKVQRSHRQVRCFVDRINTGNGWSQLAAGQSILPQGESASPPEVTANPIAVPAIERDVPFRAELSVASPFAHAGFRYRRTGQEKWDYLAADQRVLEMTFEEAGTSGVEVQAFDHSHNFSPVIELPVRVYLPLWRWQIVRWGAACLLLLGLGVTVYSAHASRRSRLARRRAEEETIRVEKARRSLAEESSLERERLLLRVCHDLKNPLNVVFACTEMLKSGDLVAAEAAPLLNGSAESMDYLSKQLLSYSKVRKMKEVENRFVAVEQLMSDLQGESKFIRRKIAGEVEVDLSSDAPGTLYTDPHAVKEILRNLLDNAFKHCPEGRIKLSYGVEAGLPIFAVEDSGPGMPESELDSIFNAFYQAGDRESRKDGLGLGLAICSTLARRLGGSLRVESKLGVGSRFIVELPMEAFVEIGKTVHADGEQAGNGERARETVDADGNGDSSTKHAVGDVAQADHWGASPHVSRPGMRPDFAGAMGGPTGRQHEPALNFAGPVLVIDDLEYVGATVVQRLHNLGLQASYAGPLDGVARALGENYPEVLVDLNMQGKDGFAVARELREKRGDSVQIVAMSESDALLKYASLSGDFSRSLPKTRLFEMLGNPPTANTARL